MLGQHGGFTLSPWVITNTIPVYADFEELGTLEQCKLYNLKIYQMIQSAQWISMEFSKILHKPSEVLHSDPFNEVMKSKCGIRL